MTYLQNNRACLNEADNNDKKFEPIHLKSLTVLFWMIASSNLISFISNEKPSAGESLILLYHDTLTVINFY